MDAWIPHWCSCLCSVRPTTNGDEVAEREKSVEKTKAAEEKAAGITAWMEKVLTEGMHMDLLLREPEWEGGWEKVVSGM